MTKVKVTLELDILHGIGCIASEFDGVAQLEKYLKSLILDGAATIIVDDIDAIEKGN